MLHFARVGHCVPVPWPTSKFLPWLSQGKAIGKPIQCIPSYETASTALMLSKENGYCTLHLVHSSKHTVNLQISRISTNRRQPVVFRRISFQPIVVFEPRWVIVCVHMYDYLQLRAISCFSLNANCSDQTSTHSKAKFNNNESSLNRKWHTEILQY